MLAHAITGPEAGSILIFLHGAGTTSWMWGAVIDRLPNQRCMVIDLPGHGKSSHIPWVSLENTAEQVHQTIMQVTAKQEAHLVGLSLGSYVAMTLLAQQPTAYASATLSGMHAGGMPKKHLMKAITWLTAPLATKPFMARQTAKMLGGKDTDIEAFVREAGTNDPTSLRRATLDAVDFEMPKAAHAIQTRVMVAAGSKEHQHILATQARLIQPLANGESYIAQGVGHGWSMEDPAQFARLVDRQVVG